MVRIVIFVIAILGIFAGTLAYGGDRLGSWDEADPEPPSNLQPITRPEEDKKNKKDGGSAAPVSSTMRTGDAGALLELNERLQSVAAQEEDILVGLGATDCSLGALETTY